MDHYISVCNNTMELPIICIGIVINLNSIPHVSS